MQTEQTDPDTALNDDVVLAHLIRNPEFFINNQDVLPRLSIPHDTGPAVSLIEKQVSVLRGKCGHLESSLRDFIAVARENEQLHQRLHSLIQEVISAPTLEAFVKLTRTQLKRNFHADAVHLLLLTTSTHARSLNESVRSKDTADSRRESTLSQANAESDADSAATIFACPDLRIVGQKDKGVSLFKQLFAGGQTICGMPPAKQLEFLTAGEYDDVGSAALIPLYHQRQLGVIMLSSRDENRFAAGKGVMFLNQLGELLSRRLHSYGTVEEALSK
ncbi:MAG: DUF484 family protein [Granulosicoccus sp.]|nr:DUF484 family protein [Granulosicoccus sp.]